MLITRSMRRRWLRRQKGGFDAFVALGLMLAYDVAGHWIE